MPILYTFRRCPYAIRARLALAYAGLNFEIREVVLRAKPQAMLELSPKGTVPVLQCCDGTILEESLDIMHWALAQADPELWWPAELAVQQQITDLITTNDQVFKPSLDGYKYPHNSPERSAEEHRAAGGEFLQLLEDQLQQQPYLLGQKISLADAALFPFIRQFSGVDRAWFEQASFPQLRLWLQNWLQHPLFLSIMDKYPPWVSGQSPVEFSHHA